MIEVNLLPEDRRPVERTPLPRFLTILGGVIGFCIEGIFIVFLLTLIPQKKGDLVAENLRLDAAKKTIKQIEDLESRIKQVDKRRMDIQKLTNDRRVWAPILYRLSDPSVLPQRVWYKEIKLESSSVRSRRGTVASEVLVIDGYASSADEDDAASRIAAVMTFVNNLQKNHPNFSEHLAGVPEVVRVQDVRLSPSKDSPADAPKRAVSFLVKVPLKPPGAGPAKR